ncbi:MAG: HDOD domain-containing protein [Pseudomonadales bacterium]|uniref:histidine kinase n=1 Tax=Oleiphilus messinensis TaxID=141451 RepID=A0A1Y0ICX0_9GAMM|nr:HDOD domain-containing protein [Oleiphilus messinensis]ARU58402.1 GAF sensor-containing signal transduction histidine kinase/phosphohydrolase [Oleiphilus messinensis]MCG8613718.1 HDOD domain-containing protein [Pseudomonadales bacterium]
MKRHSHTDHGDLQVGKLPSLPHVLVELLHCCQQDSATFQSIADIISKDVAITARVISMANSPFYYRGQTINSIEKALFLLGLDTVKTIVITASVQQFFSSFNTTRIQYLKQFWAKSLFCALMARTLAKLTAYAQPEEAYLTGLLLNLGELVLGSNYADQYRQVQDLIADNPRDKQIELENELFMTNHCEVGAWLSQEWGLSEFTGDAIRYHHSPLDTVLDAHPLVKILYLSNQCATQLMLSSGFAENPLDSFGEADNACYEAADQLFDLTASLTHEIALQVHTEVSKVAESMGISLEDNGGQDDSKRIRLAEQVRNIGLIQSTSLYFQNAHTEADFLLQLKETSDLLFGFKNAMLFQLDSAGAHLSAVKSSTDNQDIRIVLQANRSLVATAAMEQKILSSVDQSVFSGPLPVVDQQLIRRTQSPEMVCVPLLFSEQLVGVLVMGHSSSPAAGTERLLQLFAAQVAQYWQQVKVHGEDFERGTKAPSQAELSEYKNRVNETVHEANNPLTIIRNYLQALSHKLGNDHDIQNDLDIIKEEIDRTGQIIMRLKDLNEVQKHEAKQVDINGEIRSLAQLYESSLFLTRNIQCQLKLDNAITPQQTNRNSVRQILTNLLKNSAEALQDGGLVTITTTGHVNVNGKQFLEVLISDNGPGIPDTIMKQIFNPVSSTKGKHHSGLGLSITRNLVTELDGSIRCRSTREGTEFQILIPDTAES